MKGDVQFFFSCEQIGQVFVFVFFHYVQKSHFFLEGVKIGIHSEIEFKQGSVEQWGRCSLVK